MQRAHQRAAREEGCDIAKERAERRLRVPRVAPDDDALAALLALPGDPQRLAPELREEAV